VFFLFERKKTGEPYWNSLCLPRTFSLLVDEFTASDGKLLPKASPRLGHGQSNRARTLGRGSLALWFKIQLFWQWHRTGADEWGLWRENWLVETLTKGEQQPRNVEWLDRRHWIYSRTLKWSNMPRRLLKEKNAAIGCRDRIFEGINQPDPRPVPQPHCLSG